MSCGNCCASIEPQQRAVSRVLVTTADQSALPGYFMIAIDLACVVIVLWVYVETLAPLFAQSDPNRWLVLAGTCVTSVLLIAAIGMQVRYALHRKQSAYAGNAFWQLRQAMQPLLSTSSVMFVVSTWATYHIPWDAPASIALYVAIAVAKLSTFQIANAHRRMLVRHILVMEKHILDPTSLAPVTRRGPMEAQPPPPPDDDADDPYKYSTLQEPSTFSTRYSQAPSLRPHVPTIRLPKSNKRKQKRKQKLDSPRDGISLTSVDDAERSGDLIDGTRGGW